MTFDDLDRELDRWRALGRVATLWWRDDDAVERTPALDRLAALAVRHRVPVALAVIPAALESALALPAGASVLQHGYAHRNHAPAGAKTRELGARPLAEVMRDLADGQARLRAAFGAAFLPVVVPPWNRIDDDVVAALPAAGFAGLSTFGPRAAASPVPGLVCCNAHVDPVAWRAGRGFAGAGRCLRDLVAHLADRREGRADAGEPTGYLTHHLVHGDDAWAFTEALLARSVAHGSARWLAAAEAFTCGRPA